MLKWTLLTGLAAWVTAGRVLAHDGPRVWIDQTGGTIATFTSDNDLSPTVYTPSRLFTTDLESLFNVWLSEFPGYEVKRTGASVAADTTFGFSIAGPLLAFDSTDQVYRTTATQFSPAPQIGVVFGSSIITTGSGPVPGVDFFNYQETGDHSHLMYAMFGNGSTASDGPPGVYALPLRLTSPTLATSRTYYILIGNQMTVDATAIASGQQSLAGPTGASWDATTAGAWETASNWDATVPNGAGSAAILGDRITSDATITLASPKTVGRLTFDSVHRYTLAGAQLTLSETSSTGTIQIRSGQHTIDAPLTVSNDAVIDVSPNDAMLSLRGAIHPGASTQVTKRGPGTFEIGRLGFQSLIVEDGCVRILPEAMFSAIDQLSSLTVAGEPDAWTAKLDLTDNGLAIRYTGVSPIATVTNQLRSGRNGGAWDGTGIASSLAGGTHSLGVSDDGNQVLIRFTYTGDANLDGMVDISDLALLATAWQSPGNWANGDFNYDGIVDITDLASLATNWQAGVQAPAGMSFDDALAGVGLVVPEPTVAAIALLGFMLPRRKCPRRDSNPHARYRAGDFKSPASAIPPRRLCHDIIPQPDVRVKPG